MSSDARRCAVPRAAPRALARPAALLLALLLGLLGSTHAQKTFVTSLGGLGSVPIGATPLGWPGVSLMTLQFLNDTDPDAVCNDGSSAGYYIAQATNASSANLWLVYLEGSMFCYNGESCHDRYQSRPYWMGSALWAPTLAQYGIFDIGAAESSWSAANRIYVKYCSSDLWSGDIGASTNTWGFAFRGTRIISAVIQSLVNEYGMGATPGQRLLFGGCSAGAIGAMNNLDAVAAMVPHGLQVQGLLDAASLVDIKPTGWPFSPDLIPLQTQIATLVAAITPTFAPTCVAKYSGLAAWKCLLGQYRMPLLATPFFANIPQIDDFEIQYDSDNLAPSTPAQFAFIDDFQTKVLALIASLPSGTGVFSPTCLLHCLSGQPSYQDLWVNLPTANWTMSRALTAWYFQDIPVQVVSPCRGWNCTAACGATANGIPCNAGTGYKASTCLPLNLPTSSPDEAPPAPSTDTAGVPIPGDTSGTDDNGGATGIVAVPPPPSVLRLPFARASSAPAASSDAAPAAAKHRSSSHDNMMMFGTITLFFAGAALCLAGRSAVQQAIPSERQPLMPHRL